ncbi:MAG: SRPBCC family protein [Actinomycetota bacterium]
MTTHPISESTDPRRTRTTIAPVAARSRLVSATSARVTAASPERLWTVLADEFDAVGDWASTVEASTAWPAEATHDTPAADRYCDVPGLGRTRERITAYDPVARMIGYEVEAHGMPGFLRSVESTWRITPLDSGDAEVRLTIDARVSGPAARLLTPMLRSQFRRTQRRVLADLDVYARSGEVSGRKARMTAGR